MKETKICSMCKIEHNEWKKGTWCKACNKKCKQEWYRKNRSNVLNRVTNNYLNDKDYKLEYAKEYREQNKDKVQDYFEKNKTKIYKQRAEREKTRRKQDVSFRIASNLRARLRQAIKNNKKTTTTIDYLGCTINELKIHLEAKFTVGMSWDNYGKWHIDHIRPCSSFDMSKEIEQKECFHYTNLQPLWAIDNIRKSDKYN
jgi:hypothetical protein